MSENLNVAKYRNGDTIPVVENNEEWVKAGNEGWMAFFWTFGQNEYGETRPRCLRDDDDELGNGVNDKGYGLPVRCIKD